LGTAAKKQIDDTAREAGEIPLAVGHDDFGARKQETLLFGPTEVTPENRASSISKTMHLSISTATASKTPNSAWPNKASPRLIFQTNIDHRDPFNIARNLTYGPWRPSNHPSSVLAGEPFKLKFHCTVPDASLCPPYFLVFFHPPTLQTILFENFRKKSLPRCRLPM